MGGHKKKNNNNNNAAASGAMSPDSTEVKSIVPREMSVKTLSTSFDTEVRPLIDLIDKLRGYGLDSDLNLPAVAVIGDQSAGKSSVLEAISGIQLPRGTGIVTRCPLEMRLKHVEEEGKWEGKISYQDKLGQGHEQKILTPQAVGGLVKKAQNDMTDHDKGITDELITLEVMSSDVPDLTVIDLPGIARNAVEGQPADIEHRIKSLIRKYIQRQETIILAVLQCNIDIATCEALKMAREFDDQGGRTLGVLTKPDLLDKGSESDVMRILNNTVHQLSKGYIIVRCRGQEAIREEQSLKEALEVEADFFRNHRHFGTLRPSQWGITTLAMRLSRELKKHIKMLLPDLKEDVRIKLLDTEHRLHELGDDPPETPSQKRQMALTMVTHFHTILERITNGYHANDPKVPASVDKFYCEVRKCFHELHSAAKGYEPSTADPGLRRDLERKMEESRGREFVNFKGKFELLEAYAREYAQRLKYPSLRCMDKVHEKMVELLKILAQCCFGVFPDFADKAKEIIFKIKADTLKDGKEEIERYFKMEDLVYSQDPIYASELKDEEKSKNEEKTQSGMNTPTDDDVNGVTKTLMSLSSYYQVSLRRVCDIVPMIIQLQIFKEMVAELHTQLMDIASDERIMEHIREDADMATQRAENKERLRRLQMASEELDKI